MKPRLKLISGLWYCANYSEQSKTWHSPKGMGFTWREAYENWRKV